MRAFFAPINASTAGAIAGDVRYALEMWEPRIDLQDVLVSFDQADLGTLYIDIHYSVRGVNDPRNLVFPFYVIPDEPATVSIRGSRAAGSGSSPASD